MKITYPFTSLLGVFLPAFLVAGQEPSPEEIEAFQAGIGTLLEQQFIAQNETFGAWVGISDPYYGDLYFVYGNDTSPDDHFDIGSVSKTFGATVLLLLVERGDLALSDTVQTLVPEFAADFPEYADNTLEELLRMDTLVPDILNDPEGILADQSRDLSKRYTVDELVAFAMQRYPIENEHEYSSTNFIVAEYIAEMITNQTAQELLQELILTPLDLSSTGMPGRLSEGVHPEPSATPYAGATCHFELTLFSFPNVTVDEEISEFSQCIVMAGYAGSIYSNIYDLLAWAKSGTGDSLLSPETVALRHQYNTDLSPTAIYGIGQYQEPEENGDVFKNWAGHDGDAFGYSAKAWHNEVLNASVAFGANTCSYTALGTFALAVLTENILSRTGDMEEESGNSSAMTDDEGMDADDNPGSDEEGGTEAPSMPSDGPESSAEKAQTTFFGMAAMLLMVVA